MCTNLITETTKVAKANSRSKSLKTTIPVTIVKLMSLEEKDVLEWNVVLNDNNDMWIVLKKLE